jgi:putative ABC transport system permease protein
MRAALRLVWTLDVRHLVAHRTRLALSALGIAVGVALAVAVGSLSSSVTGSLEAIAQAAASDANVEIRPNGRGGLPPSVLGRVRSVAGVEEAGATVESYVQIRNDEERLRVLALGFDLGILRMAPTSVDPASVQSADPNGLMLPADVADMLGVRAGDRIDITTPTGWHPVRIGTVLPAGAAERSRVVVAPVGVLQRVLGRGTSYDAIYVKADDPEARLAAIGRAVGGVGRAGPIAFRSDQIQQLLAGASASFSVGTIVALFVGGFLVYNTMAMAAVERVREAALLRAVGAKRRQVFALFLAEGGVLGVIGSLLGVAGGLLLTKLLLFQQGSALEVIYPIQFTKLSVSPRVLTAAGVAGVVSALAAALLPARRIARSDPAPSLGPAGTFEDPTRKRRPVTIVVALVCAAAGTAITVPAVASGSNVSGAALAGMALVLTGIALLIPIGVPLVAAVLLGAIQTARRATGVTRLASGEILRAPGRTSFTVGAVLLSLALVVGFSIAQTSFTRAFDTAFEDIIAADLYVRSATWRVFGSDVPLDEKLGPQIERVPGVAAAWPFRLVPSEFREKPLIVLAYDTTKYGTYSHVTGDAKREVLEQARALRAPNTVLASDSLLTQHDYKVGDTIALPTPTGTHRVRIAGTINDPSALNPEVVFDHATFTRFWGTGGADTFGVVVEDGSDATAVRREIAARFGPRFGLAVDTQQQYYDRLSGTVNSVTQLIGSVQLVAVIVAALGLANTLLISTLERRRDLGVLRAVGMQRRQLRRMVAAEALMIGGIGVLLAWALGTLIGLGMFGFVRAQLGIALTVAFPLSGYGGAAILGLLAAFAASIYPAQRAARLDVVAALQYE